MRVSKRCQYALRALFELSLQPDGRPMKIHQIAGAQKVPPRFLEVILNELKHAGFVDSRRGSEGGYVLARPAKDLTVGEVIEYIQGPIYTPVADAAKHRNGESLLGDYAFQQLWRKVSDAVSGVWDNTTFAELVEYEMAKKSSSALNYAI
ncbi:MAG: Rrf2 family transcriptional regulator [Phycisphaerales bacterium]|nr:MAG: Rrf2 family transcriptional regulator [Phycisphaerales bacterium]